jgi:hypothetical protein
LLSALCPAPSALSPLPSAIQRGDFIMKIIFLDIDGVLQPDTQKRFDHDLDALKEEFVKQNREFEALDKYDIGAVYYDWDKTAIELMKKLCAKTGAGFVISSDWRIKTLKKLKLLFSIHEMDKYILDTLPSELTGLHRSQEIQNYLKEHQEIARFVIIDDAYSSEFNRDFPSNFVHTGWAFNLENYEKAEKILTGN